MTVLDFLQYFLIDLPEAFILLMLGLSVYNKSTEPMWYRVLLYAASLALFGRLLSYSHLDYQYWILLYSSGMLVIFYLLGYRLYSLGMAIIAGSWMLLIHSSFLALVSKLGFDTSIFADYSLLYKYSLSYGYLILLALSGLVLKMNKFDIRNLLPVKNTNKYLMLLLTTGGASILSILLVNMSTLVKPYLPIKIFESTEVLWPFQFATLILMLLTGVFFVLYLRATIQRVEIETAEPYNQQILDLTTAVRSIKHDSSHHYTVILSFLRMNELMMTIDYVSHLLSETQQIIDLTEGVKNRTVAALLYGKIAHFTKEGVDFQIKISPDAPQFENWKDIDITKLLGNLLENAFTATLEVPEKDRYIRIEWGIKGDQEYLFIENSGPTIPESILPKLFDLGFSTRRPEGEGGIGLAVVKGLVAKYKGVIKVFSKDNVTRFTLTFPITDKTEQSLSD